ncbi:MAG: trimethylamine methyltransferase family protein [Actinobacteria bacterium]|nr:trimethylamine methyltransferase family protein [Actinomycetota bacterium]
MYKLRRYEIFPDKTINRISNASFDILENIGVKVPNQRIWHDLKEFGAVVNENTEIVKLPAEITKKAIELAGKQHILYGRDRNNVAEFGFGMFNFNGSAGQYQLIDEKLWIRTDPTLADLRKAIKIGDALKHINVVGAMVVPFDIHPKLRDVYTFFELLTGTTKPFTGWIFSGKSAEIIIEIMKIVSGSPENLKKYPPYEAFIEPISPLSFRSEAIDILIEFAKADMPVCFGPMVQAGATGPIYLAGAITQENAEILAGVVLSQALRPGLPVTYGGIPHIMDMKTSTISFGSPEQGLMAAAITQLAKSYGFPVYNNTGITDAKIPDAQSGIEKAATIMLGALAGGDIFGHLGISGADNGANLAQLIIDDEMAGYIKRVMGSFEVTDETISLDVIKDIGITGNFMMHEQTLSNYKKEIWYPEILDRFAWDTWEKEGKKTITDRALEKESAILKSHEQTFLDQEVQKECHKVIRSFEKRLDIK